MLCVVLCCAWCGAVGRWSIDASHVFACAVLVEELMDLPWQATCRIVYARHVSSRVECGGWGILYLMGVVRLRYVGPAS